MIRATLSLEQVAGRSWDVLVIGAGPAGSVAAHALARTGCSVLLADRCAFPRRKTCGCCVSAAAVQLLRRAGMLDVARLSSATPLMEFRLMAGGRQASIPLPGGVALSRETFDTALIQCAQAAGATFVPEADAALEGVDASTRRVWLTQAGTRWRITAHVVLAADGLGGKLLQAEPACRVRTEPHARIGLSAIMPEAPDWCAPGVIFMACGAGGYAGLVRLEDGRLNIAAALAPSTIALRGAGATVVALLQDAGVPVIEGVDRAAWQGVPALSRRRRRVAATRLFVLGDSAGYVEPFTGEGMAWAIASGMAVAPLAVAGAKRWTQELSAEWDRRYRRLLGRRQRHCRLMTRALRHPALTEAGIRLLSWFPGLAAPVIKTLNTW